MGPQRPSRASLAERLANAAPSEFVGIILPALCSHIRPQCIVALDAVADLTPPHPMGLRLAVREVCSFALASPDADTALLTACARALASDADANDLSQLEALSRRRRILISGEDLTAEMHAAALRGLAAVSRDVACTQAIHHLARGYVHAEPAVTALRILGPEHGLAAYFFAITQLDGQAPELLIEAALETSLPILPASAGITLLDRLLDTGAGLLPVTDALMAVDRAPLTLHLARRLAAENDADLVHAVALTLATSRNDAGMEALLAAALASAPHLRAVYRDAVALTRHPSRDKVLAELADPQSKADHRPSHAVGEGHV